MKYNDNIYINNNDAEEKYEITHIEMETIEGGLSVRATIKTQHAELDIVEWLNENFEEAGYLLEDVDVACNDVAIKELFPHDRHVENSEGFGNMGLSPNVFKMWVEVEAWVSKQTIDDENDDKDDENKDKCPHCAHEEFYTPQEFLS